MKLNLREKGQGMMEYALILVLTAIVVIAALTILGPFMPPFLIYTFLGGLALLVLGYVFAPDLVRWWSSRSKK